MKKLILAACAAALISPTAFAIPARRGAIYAVEQPDGSTLSVARHGDERSHYTTTADGIPVVDFGDGAGYCYATVDLTGRLVSTGVTAADSDKRPAEHRNLISAINIDATCKALTGGKREESTQSRMTAPRRNPGLNTSTFVAKGEMHTLVILVNYSDKKIVTPNPTEYFTRMCNEEGFSDYRASGSVRDYFRNNSLNAFSPIFDVYGPVELGKSMRYYGQNDWYGDDKRAHEMAIDALRILCDEGTVDPDKYDFDNDGYIDNVYIIYAGYPESGVGSADTVWPHSWDIEEIEDADDYYDLTYGTKRLNHYACSSELSSGVTPEGIGTIVHEFSHVLGLPDLYATDGSSSSETPGCWSVLDQGCYNNDSRTPVGYSMFERYALDWIKPVELNGPADVTLPPLTEGHGAIIRTDNPNEFFLLENRTATSWDTYIAAKGMLVWHVDYDEEAWIYNTVNNDKKHQHVDLVEADGTSGCYDGSNVGNPGGDPFPGNRKVTTFEPQTWDGTDLELPLTEITLANGLITFKVKGGGEAGINSVNSSDKASVTVDGSDIVVNTPATSHIIVSDIAGRTIAHKSAEGTSTFTVHSAGIYLVNIDGVTYKVAVR